MSENSGKSKSRENPTGVRRKSGGKELAPKSLRRKFKKKFVSEFTTEQIEKALKG
jgi:hypothetical protein